MKTGNRIVAVLAALLLMASSAAFARGYIQNPALLDKIKAGMTDQEVEQILGPPKSRSDFARVGLISMDYSVRIWTDLYDVGVMIGKDGIVKEVQKIKRSGSE